MLKRYQCQCGNPVFFPNSVCLVCNTPLGYDTGLGLLIPLKPGEQPGQWLAYQAAATPAESEEAALPRYIRCANLETPAACNWLLAVSQPGSDIFCRACCLNRTIPDLADPDHPQNGMYWGRVELAKRRMLAGLLGLNLAITSKQDDPAGGLAFDLISSQQGASPVLTGHDSGLITLNLQEADDAARESIRSAMGEPYRTLLGHFRHETGHYFWDRLVNNSGWLDGFRQLFGDESQDYAAALQNHYAAGPPKDWWLNYVSSYSASHPWEDWAETWAHYLHMCDTVDTATSFGLDMNAQLLDFTPFTLDALYDPNDKTAAEFLTFLNEWMALTVLLNEMSRSMGQADFYPFVLPGPVVAKLQFVHLVIRGASHT